MNIWFLKIGVWVKHIYVSEIISFLNVDKDNIDWEEKDKASSSLLKQIYWFNLVIFTVQIAILFYHLVLKNWLDPIQKLIWLPLKEVHLYIHSLIKDLYKLVFQINRQGFAVIDNIFFIVYNFFLSFFDELWVQRLWQLIFVINFIENIELFFFVCIYVVKVIDDLSDWAADNREYNYSHHHD